MKLGQRQSGRSKGYGPHNTIYRQGAGRESGTALALALISVVIVGAAGSAYLQVTTAGSARQGMDTATTKAFYVAEAGLAEAFHAVRIGRSGQIGAPNAPARFGNGLVWVESEFTGVGQIRLTSTALAGKGRAALSYTLEPTSPLLGVFAVEDLSIDQVLLVDGYNSDEGSYWDHIPTDHVLEEPISAATEALLSATAGDSTPLGCHLGYHNWCAGELSHSARYGDPNSPEFAEAYVSRSTGVEALLPLYREQLNAIYEADALTALATGAEDIPMRPPVGVHTGENGVLGSNGSIDFDLSSGEFSEVYGDIQPGPDGSAQFEDDAVVTGSDAARSIPVDLPAVEIPVVEIAEGITHDGILPYTLASGTHGIDSFVVEPDSELIIQGPATLVVGNLTLKPGATLTLDTRAGDVALFVTEGLDFQAGSTTITSGGRPQDLTVQIAPIQSAGDMEKETAEEPEPVSLWGSMDRSSWGDDDGDGESTESDSTDTEPPIRFDSSSAFHGTIYAPETAVYVGSDFEVFGSVVARKLSFGPGARIHVDHAGTGGSALPEIVAWQIVETPAMVKGKGRDPFFILDVDPEETDELAGAHDLTGINLHITYLAFDGSESSYSGPEADFAWGAVASVVRVERDRTNETASRIAAAPGPMAGLAASEEEPEPALSVRREVSGLDAMINMVGMVTGGRVTADALVPLAPLTPEEWDLMRPHLPNMDVDQAQRIIDADIAAGGTGGI